VNGEGTMHHDSRGCEFLMKVLSKAQRLGKHTALINTVWQGNKDHRETLSKLDMLTARDIMSYNQLTHDGGKPLLIPDLCLASDFSKGKVTKELKGVVVGTFHPHSACAGIEKDEFLADKNHYGFEDSFVDMVANLKQADCYITGSHHGVYAAGIAGIPFIPVPSNSWKVESLVKWSGAPIPICRTIEEVKDCVSKYRSRMNIYSDFHKFLMGVTLWTK